MIFRKSIKNIVKNKYAFVIISGLLFGLLHISDYTDIKEYIMSVSYIVMGLDFAYIYHKTNNIFTTMSIHSFHNLLLFITTIL